MFPPLHHPQRPSRMAHMTRSQKEPSTLKSLAESTADLDRLEKKKTGQRHLDPVTGKFKASDMTSE